MEETWWEKYPKKLSEHARLLGTSEYCLFQIRKGILVCQNSNPKWVISCNFCGLLIIYMYFKLEEVAEQCRTSGSPEVVVISQDLSNEEG